MGEFNKLSFEIENRAILLHKDTSLQDGNFVEYTGNPNNINITQYNSEGERLIANAPAGTLYIDKTNSPVDVQIKIEDTIGGLYKIIHDTNLHNDLLGRDATDAHPISAIIGLQDAINNKADSTTLNAHITDFNNPHMVDKTDVGLSNVDNTSDLDKPISTATQDALDNKADSTALNNHITDFNNPHMVDKTDVGLGNVDNTSDLDKPISNATQDALDTKLDSTTFSVHITDFNNPHMVDKTDVGLSNVDNTSDLDKPISTATQNALDAKPDNLSELDDVDTTGVLDQEVLYFDATSGTQKNKIIINGITVHNSLSGRDTTDAHPINAITGLQDVINTKLDSTTFSVHITDFNNPHMVDKTDVGLGNVDNTSDLDKPISTATQNALDDKADSTTLNDHITDFNNPHMVDKVDVGLSNVDNTSDLDKPISTATQNALDDKPDNLSELDDVDTTGVLDQEVLYFDATSGKQKSSATAGGITVHNSLSGRDTTDAHPINAITGLQNALDDKADSTALNDHITDVNNPHMVDKVDVGLGNVDNTSDLDKPISTATQNALDDKPDNLSELDDVDTTGVLDQQILKFDSVSGKQKPEIDNSGITVHNSLSDRDATDSHPISAITGLQEELDDITDIYTDREEPTGFLRLHPETMGILSVNNTTRSVTIQPKAGQTTFSFYNSGKKYEISTAKTLQIPNQTNHYMCYFDNTGSFMYTDNDLTLDLVTKCTLVAQVYYNATTSQIYVLADERHGIGMSGETHINNHLTRGAAYANGLDIIGLSSNNYTYDKITSGLCFDEDILIEIPDSTSNVFIYTDGTAGEQVETSADNNIGYKGVTNVVYNKYDTTTKIQSLEELDVDNAYTIYHFIASNNILNPVYKVIGQNAYSSRDLARSNIVNEIKHLKLKGLYSNEFIFLYSIIVKYDGTLIPLANGDTYVDLRNIQDVNSGYSDSEINNLITESISGYINLFNAKELAKERKLNQTRQFLFNVNQTDPKCRIVSADDYNMIQRNGQYLTTLNKGQAHLITDAETGDYFDSKKGIGIAVNSVESVDSAAPAAFFDTKFFFYAFRSSDSGKGKIYIACGPIKSKVKMTDGLGNLIDGPVELDPNQTTILYTQGNKEYIIEATNEIIVYITSNNGSYDQRLLPPLSTEIIGQPRLGYCSALYANTVVNQYKRDGSSGTFTVSPGSPVNISNEIGSEVNYDADGITIMKASGPISAMSGADNDGLNATAWFPLDIGLARRFPITSGIASNQHISIASPYKGEAILYDINGDIKHVFKLSTDGVGDNFPYGDKLRPSSNIAAGGYIECDVPCYVCVDFSSDSELTQNSSDETILLGTSPKSFDDHLLDTNAHDIPETLHSFETLYYNKELAKENKLNRTRQYIPIINSSSPICRIVSAADYNVIYRKEKYLTTLNKGQSYLVTDTEAGDYFDSKKGIGIAFNANSSVDSAVPAGFFSNYFFFYAFRFSAPDRGYIYVTCGPLKSRVEMKNTSGAIVDGPYILDANEIKLFKTPTEGEYSIVATEDVCVYITSNKGAYDQRLLPPLSTEIIGQPRRGYCSALYANTVVNQYKRDGSSGTFTVSPGSPVNINSEIGSLVEYDPDDLTIMKASGPISAMSGADNDGGNATAQFPLDIGLGKLFPFTAAVATGEHIAIASPYDCTAKLFDSTGILIHEFILSTDGTSNDFPFADRQITTSDVMPGGQIETSAPAYICIDITDDPDMAQDDGNETILLGQIDDTLEKHLLNKTDAHPISAITNLEHELNSKIATPSGVISGGELSGSYNALEIIVSSGSGLIVDPISDPYNVTSDVVSQPDRTISITPTAVDTEELYQIYVDKNANIISIILQDVVPADSYDYILLGYIEISSNSISNIINAPIVISQTPYNLYDLFQIMPDSAKTKGMRLCPTDELSVYCQSGEIFIPGINQYSTPKNQNILTIPQSGDETTPIIFKIFNQFGQSIMPPVSIIPKYYDNTGAVESLTGGEAVIHYVYYSASGFYLQLGDKRYKSFNDAFKNIDKDRAYYNFAPGAGIAGKSILIGQIVVSNLATSFDNRSLATIVSTINNEFGNTISPVDLTLVPQYLLHAIAAEHLSAGDELSMDINGKVQKYPATGGENTSQYTTDTVVYHSFIFLNASNNQGIIAQINNIDETINVITAQRNANGTVSYSPIRTISTAGQALTIGLCRIDSSRAGIIYTDKTGVVLGIIGNNGISVAPSTGTMQVLNSDNATADGADCVYDSSQDYLIGVYSIENTNNVYNRYCSFSGNNVNTPPYSEILMTTGEQVKCTTEGDNVIVVTVDSGNSKQIEAAWKKPTFGTGRYDDLTPVITLSNCDIHGGLQVQSGVIFAQFKSSSSLQTYKAAYTSGSSIETPVAYGNAVNCKHGDLIKTDSGIGYRVVLNNNNNIDIYEGMLAGSWDLIYTSTFNINSSNSEIKSLIFGSVFAIGTGKNTTDANMVYLIDSSLTRTDHFIGVTQYNVIQGDYINVDIALPLITLPREYSPGTYYTYGPYKYQVITNTQAVIIIESTLIQNTVT